MTVSYVTLDTLALLESISLCRPLRPAASDRVVASSGSTSCWWSANQRIAIAVRQIRSANHSQCIPRSSLVNVCNFCAPSSDIASPSASMLATGWAGDCGIPGRYRPTTVCRVLGCTRSVLPRNATGCRRSFLRKFLAASDSRRPPLITQPHYSTFMWHFCDGSSLIQIATLLAFIL